MRICKKCLIEKSLSEFYKHVCGYNHTCKSCFKLRANLWAKTNKEKRLAIVKKSRASSTVWSEYRKKWRTQSDEVATRRACKAKRTPNWVGKDELWLIREAYALSKLREKITGIKWHVDHVIPLRGKLVSGLHVPFNLQVIPAKLNLIKSNNMHFQLKEFP
jgi:hypothetical protein